MKKVLPSINMYTYFEIFSHKTFKDQSCRKNLVWLKQVYFKKYKKQVQVVFIINGKWPNMLGVKF